MTVDDLFGLLVAYEIFAVATARCPTVSRMCRQRRQLVPLVLALIAAHLIAKETP